MRIAIVDDDKLVVASLKTIVEVDSEINVVGTGNNGEEAIRLFESCKPDILLMDIRMDKMTGLEAAEVILKADGNARILLLTTFSDDEYIIKALKIGAKGYMLKQNFESIIPSLKAVFRGQNVYGDCIAARIPNLIIGGSITDIHKFGVNEKEADVIELIADGLSNKEIALRLFLSEGTVRNCVSVILEKLQLRDRTQLAIFYYKNIAKKI